MRGGLALVTIGALTLAWSRLTVACGGGGVTVQTGGAAIGAQRIFISVRGDKTDVITEVAVPATSADWGVLVPVPAQPTLDPEPVAASDIEGLDRLTAPRVSVNDEGGGGCGCPLGAGSSKNGSTQGDSGVQVGPPVTIGPLAAVVLTGDNGDAVNTWLTDNGFVIPAGQASIVDTYSGAGRYFIALRRNVTAATGGASSVGVHFSLPVATRALPLRFAQLGAAPTVTFTMFIASSGVVAPSEPFTALTLTDLDANILRSSGGYAGAVREAVRTRAGRAFVLESALTPSEIAAAFLPRIQGLIDPTARLTRLTTVLAASALTDDVNFDATFSGEIPRRRVVENAPLPRRPRAPWLVLGTALALTAVFRRSRRS
jgi:hypothetical protein